MVEVKTVLLFNGRSQQCRHHKTEHHSPKQNTWLHGAVVAVVTLEFANILFLRLSLNNETDTAQILIKKHKKIITFIFTLEQLCSMIIIFVR